MRRYFQENLDKLDIQTIKDDPYLKAIDTMWKGNNDTRRTSKAKF